VVDQIELLAAATRFDVSTEFIDDSGDSVDTYEAFVASINPNAAGDSTRECQARAVADLDADGAPDSFLAVPRRERVCFDIRARRNTAVEPTTEPQIFRAVLRVVGNGFAELDRRELFFLVPAEPARQRPI
jgi:hypothetical protein